MRNFVLHPLLIILLVLALSGCTGIQNSTMTDGKVPAIVTEKKSASTLLLIDNNTPATLVFDKKLRDSKLLDNTNEDIIGKLCGVGKPTGAEIGLSAVASFAIPKLVNLVLGKIEEKFDEMLKNYSKLYSAEAQTTEFYSETGVDLALNKTCFRFTREEGSVPALDLLGQFHLVKRDTFQIRPLRLYYSKPTAKGKKIGLAISITGQSVWRQSNTGKKAEIFDQTLISEKFKVEGKEVADDKRVKYSLHKFDLKPESFPGIKKIEKEIRKEMAGKGMSEKKLKEKIEKEIEKKIEKEVWKSHALHKIIPWSNTNSEAKGNAIIKVTIAEVGETDWILKQASKLFKKNKEKVGKLLSEAAGKLIQ